MNTRKEAEAIAEALVQNSPRGVHFYDVDAGGRLILTGANPAADAILGIDHAVLIGKTLQEAFPPLAATEIPERYKATAVDGTPWRTEQIDYKDGRVQGAYEVITFRTKPNSMAAVFSDISERKRLELDVEYQRNFSAAIIESLPGIFYLYDYPGLTLVRWNRNHETAFGYASDDMRGKSIFDWHPPAAREAVLAGVEEAMRAGLAQIEAALLSKDGSLTPYLLTGARFESAGVSYLMGVGIDISERKAAEARLRELNAELETRVADRTRSLREANGALARAMKELKASQARIVLQEKRASLGQLVTGLAHELNTPLGAILSASAAETKAERSPGAILAFYRSLDDVQADAFMRLYACCSGRPPLVGGEDRALRKRVVAALSRAGVEAPARVAALLSDAGYGCGDEELVRLAGTPGFRTIAESVHALASSERSSYIVRESAGKAASVVRALRSYNGGEAVAAPAPERIDAQIETVLTLLNSKLNHGVEVVRDYGPTPPVRCGRESLGQVWMNLIDNAAQAMAYRGRLEIVVRASGDGRFVTVSVIDDGPGIAPDARDRIFEPFFSTKAPGEGLGLGLDISRKILEAIGATIEFDSRPGRTEFRVTMPVCAEEEA